MTCLNREEFQVYCLLYAFSLNKSLKKQHLVNFALCVDAEMFVRVYNVFENCTEQIRKQTVFYNINALSLKNNEINDLLNAMRDTFFSDKSYCEIESLVISTLQKVLC